MKNRVLMFLGMVVAIIMAAALGSCDRIHDHRGLFSYADSTAIANIAQQTVSPKFSTPTEAQAYQMDIENNFKEDSVFRSMTQKEVFDVTTVLLNRKQNPTAKDIAREYMQNNSIYSNLPTLGPLQQVHTTTIREWKDTVIDTVIDGRKVYLLKNKEISHE